MWQNLPISASFVDAGCLSEKRFMAWPVTSAGRASYWLFVQDKDVIAKNLWGWLKIIILAAKYKP